MTTASSSGSTTSTTTSSSTGGAVTVTVAPNPADLLTCKTQKFTATVTNAADTTVKWSVAPTPAGGTIAADGTYTAPIMVPSPKTATVTATSNMTPTASGTAAVTLATVHPSAAKAIPLTGDANDVYSHRVAIGGQLGYAVRSGKDSTTGSDSSVQVSLSTDGGATWGAAKNIDDAIPVVGTDCVSVAVDAGDSKTAYVVYRLDSSDNTTAGCPSSGVQNQSGTTLVLAVTKDGGATFTHHTLASTYNGYSICPDVVSPSAGHVVVIAPNAATSDFGIDVYRSSTKGDDLNVPANCNTTSDFYAPLQTPSPNMFPYIGQDGGSSGVTESPRAFTDGNGNLCMTFAAYTAPPAAHAWIMCSKDNGATWSAPLKLDTATAPNGVGSTDPRLPHGAFGPNDAIAVGWWFDGYATDGSDQGLYLVTSPGLTAAGAPQPFSAPKALPRYTVQGDTKPLSTTQFTLLYEGGTLFAAEDLDDGGSNDRVAVDKSCDGGTTWSGIQLVNGPEGSIKGMLYPELIPVGGSMNMFAWDRNSQKTFQMTLEP